MAISSPGIGSNLDINGIISSLMQVERKPLIALARKEASYQAKLSAFGGLSSALSSFQTSLNGLNNKSSFQALSASASDSTVLTATASNKAAAGSYNVNVTQLAQAQTISTAGVASTTATIGTGNSTKLTFQFGTITGGKLVDGKYVEDTGTTPSVPTFNQDGSRATGIVTIDNTNNSLQGIRDAVNKANIGVTATIISDGSAAPNKLVFTSTKTGLASSMKITLDGTETALNDLLSYDPAGTQQLTQNVAAQNTALTLNGIGISSSTNSISDAIEGVTLNVAKVGTSTLSVARNTGAVQSGINAMIKTYNELNTTIRNLTAFDPATKQAGPLIGDSAPKNIQAQVRKMLSSPLTEAVGGLSTLSQIGISFQKDGSMSLDANKLQTALTNNLNGVTALFSSFGTTTDSLVSFSESTANTTPGTSDVFLKTLATQGQAVGKYAPELQSIDDTNNELSVTIDGVSATVKLLNSASYTATELAAQVQSAINGASEFSSAGIAVKATLTNDGFLKLTSNRYGSASTVVLSGTALPVLFGTTDSAPTTTAGVDAAGSIGGVAADGSGQFLTGAKGSASEGLKLQITGGAEGVGRGTVSFSQGYAFQLNKLIEGYLGSSGLLKGRTEGLDRSIKDLDKTRTGIGERLQEVEKRYRAQFTALDTTISKMTTTSAFLSQQLAALSSSLKA